MKKYAAMLNDLKYIIPIGCSLKINSAIKMFKKKKKQ